MGFLSTEMFAFCKTIYLQYRSQDRLGATFIWAREHGITIWVRLSRSCARLDITSTLPGSTHHPDL